MVESWAEALSWSTKDVKTGATTALTDYCHGCDRLFVTGEESYLGMCAECAFYIEDSVDPAWECS